MGQNEVLELLAKDPTKWWSIDEIKEKVKEQYNYFGNVWRQVNRLCANEEVETKLIRLDNCRWGYKRVVKAKEK